MALSIHRNLLFFHDFKQGCLRFACCPIDFVCEQKAALQYRPFLKAKGSASAVIHRKTRNIRWHDVRCELDSSIRESQRFAEGKSKRGFANSRYIFQQNISFCQNGHQDFLKSLLFSFYHFACFLQNCCDFLIHIALYHSFP